MSSQTKPIQINEFVLAIRDLSDENLHSILAQLDVSIQKLKESNEILKQEIENTKEAVASLKEGESHDALREDLVLYNESIEENEEVITNQTERVTELKKELTRRGVPLSIDVQKEHDTKASNPEGVSEDITNPRADQESAATTTNTATNDGESSQEIYL